MLYNIDKIKVIAAHVGGGSEVSSVGRVGGVLEASISDAVRGEGFPCRRRESLFFASFRDRKEH